MVDRARASLFSALLGLLAASVPAQDKDTKWMRLWNGKDLQGWRVLAGYWKVDSGMIVGKGSLPNHNSFAIPPGTYFDFELSVKARLFERGISWYTNSGIQYRSRIVDTAKKILQGPQLDIGDGASASMYAEGGHGGPNQGSSAACRSAMKMDEWNHYLIVANGSRVGHRLNGAVCNDFTSSVSSGVIGLQLHFVVNAQPGQTMEVNFKDVYIRPLNNSFTIPDSLAIFLDASYGGGTVGLARPAPARGVPGSRPGLTVLLDGAGRAQGLALRTSRGTFDPMGRALDVSAPGAAAPRPAGSAGSVATHAGRRE